MADQDVRRFADYVQSEAKSISADLSALRDELAKKLRWEDVAATLKPIHDRLEGLGKDHTTQPKTPTPEYRAIATDLLALREALTKATLLDEVAKLLQPIVDRLDALDRSQEVPLPEIPEPTPAKTKDNKSAEGKKSAEDKTPTSQHRGGFVDKK